MNRQIPLWVFLLCILFGALFTMFFGWSVLNSSENNKRKSFFGKIAVEIASFPTLAKSVFIDVSTDTLNKNKHNSVPRTSADLSEFTPVKSKAGIDVSGLLMRADKAALSRASGWRILVGAFTINGELQNAALALTPELEIANIWILTEQEIDGKKPRKPYRKFIHGFDILKDGSVIFTFDGGISIQRFNKCSERVWGTRGEFGHAVTLIEDEKFAWTLSNGNKFTKVTTATGKIIREFTLQEIITANPTIDILEIRKKDANDLGGNSRNTKESWLNEPFHSNDIDPLPAALADRYDNFVAGDLLISVRSLNLIFVVDPNTLEIKWWRTGIARRQHDPDWSLMGEITVFDNRMSRDYSQIVSISPKTYKTKVLLDGRKNNFYSRIRGKHQITADGNLIVTSSQQGRIFEIDPNGKVILDILNTKPGDDKVNYALSQAIWLPIDTYNFQEDKSCKN